MEAGETTPAPAEELQPPVVFVAPLQLEMAAASVVLPERLQRREAERQQGVERQRQKKEAQVVKEERSEFFVAAFAREREAVEALLAGGTLEEAAARLQGLQKMLTESVRFLAAYEVRQGQEAVARLQADLAARRQQLQPKKKFAFRTLKKEAAPGSDRRPEEPARPAVAPPTPPDYVSAEGPSLCGFRGAEDRELEMGAAELLQRDVELSGLRGCRVRLRGNANTLRVRDCRGCTLLCGPVSTSVQVDDCSDCLLVLACQQLRTYRTRDCRFYVLVTSRVVIEESTRVSFAPYTWSYPGIDRDFESSGLDRKRNNWNTVDDFHWLAADKPSPNWSLIPEQERISCWD
ncbi:tubulin-specific chaperone C [Phaethornis superciliosus]